MLLHHRLNLLYFAQTLLFENKFSEKLLFLPLEPFTTFKIGLGSGEIVDPFNEVATIDTLILPFIFSSLIAPKINSASGSTSALILFTAASTSKSLISLPPVILTSNPLAPCKVYSSINGLNSLRLTQLLPLPYCLPLLHPFPS